MFAHSFWPMFISSVLQTTHIHYVDLLSLSQQVWLFSCFALSSLFFCRIRNDAHRTVLDCSAQSSVASMEFAFEKCLGIKFAGIVALHQTYSWHAMHFKVPKDRLPANGGCERDDYGNKTAKWNCRSKSGANKIGFRFDMPYSNEMANSLEAIKSFLIGFERVRVWFCHQWKVLAAGNFVY